MQKNYKINILTLKFMSLMGNKSSGTIFGSHACRFQISSALSELNAPLREFRVNFNREQKFSSSTTQSELGGSSFLIISVILFSLSEEFLSFTKLFYKSVKSGTVDRGKFI